MYKDIGMRYTPKEQTSPRFRVQCISDFYYSWGADVADFNKDGNLDIVAGAYIYYGPDFTKHREIYPAMAVGPSKEFTPVNHQFTYDVNGDGLPDVISGWTAPGVYINLKINQGDGKPTSQYPVHKVKLLFLQILIMTVSQS